ncbi:AcrR family transcriptional regulator [Streptomyces sp. LBL]|uniref:TetR/AcrR family transcriptional regulator n=1 Tax=Streptomyces sp. LBL TaxID=2940562 RepID=UPI002476472F|nr:TetR/AcrR family transcriptional regulator C-terminal domain-containing protein [Streptomyces sp. LBL]MDH6625223.1 AcrR family transcriptional regulator [Streptomyces sp. LBL]
MAAKATQQNPIPSVWARPQPRSDQPTLSRTTIVREAIVMLDTEGIEALSMRKLGARLNAGAASLYRHVATKDELLELAVDEVAAELHVPSADTPDGWRAAVTEAARSFRSAALRHPWLPAVLGQVGLVYLGPHLMAFSERLGGLFTEAGLPEPSGAMDTVLSYVIGMSTTEAAWLSTVARSGASEADFVTRLLPATPETAAGPKATPGPVATDAPETTDDPKTTDDPETTAGPGHVDGPDHPAGPREDITAAAADPAALREKKFAYGLEVVLDGLALRLPK